MTDSLDHSLNSFQKLVNDHPRLRSLLKGWDKDILVESTDTNETYRLTFADTKLVQIESPAREEEADITVRAEARLLNDVFTGISNPATLFLEGTLQVFASDKDQIKLDAIALVLWD